GFVDAVVPRPELRAALARLLRLLPVPAVGDGPAVDTDRGWGPIGTLTGLAERFGGAVSETIGIDVDHPPGGNGRGPGSDAPAPSEPAASEPAPSDPERGS
ncbi:MAG TPA: hypothetical protein VMP86_06735, partial [Candidatus Binatia bacterium]|nr:hypothetical protein [Candidatus Binatia bacterium]